MRVMTLNILFGTATNRAGRWEDRRERIAEVVREWAPDVLAVQEAMAFQLRDLGDLLPDYRVMVGEESGVPWIHRVSRIALPAAGVAAVALRLSRVPRRLSAPTIALAGLSLALPAVLSQWPDSGEHCAILYRSDHLSPVQGGTFWLSSTPERPGSVLPGSWLPRIVTWAKFARPSDGPVTLYNTHFDFLPWAATRSARILRGRMDQEWDGTPQILVGDLNAPGHWPLFRTLYREEDAPGLRSAWDRTSQPEGPEATHHAGGGIGRWPGRLDHILYRPALEVSRVVTITHHLESVYPSDHFPVLADFPDL